MRIILLNGAPFSGKDTLMNRLLDAIPDSQMHSFKTVLYRRFSEKFNLTIEETIALCTGPQKDKPSPLLNGLIPRQELIFISEKEIKATRGEDGVAELTVHDMLEVPCHGRKTFIFPDSGFPNERGYLTSALKPFGLVDIYLVRILRDGYTFESVNDSRTYLPDPDAIITNDVDESHLPESEVGENMLEQFLKAYK